MDIKDVAGLGAPLSKLIKALSDGAGVFYEPTRIRKEANARADAAITEAKANVEIKKLMARAEHRARVREVRRQTNLEKIVGGASRLLPASVDSTPIEPDWIAEFVNCSEDVSDEQMQTLWSRLLAGETAKTGSFSRRTLAMVRTMSKVDAEIFTRYCSFVWSIEGEPHHILAHGEADLLERAGVGYALRQHLRAIGLITDEGSRLTLDYLPLPAGTHTFTYFGTSLEVVCSEDTRVDVVELTASGRELAQIAGATRNDEYFRLCVAQLRGRNSISIRESSREESAEGPAGEG